MLTWVAYLLLISGILSLGAFSLERAIRPRGYSTRWIWACALIGSLALPLILSATLRPIEVAGVGIDSPGEELHGSAYTPHEWSTQLPTRFVRSDWLRFGELFQVMWILSSCSGAAVLMAGSCYGARRRRRWRRAYLAGAEVFVAQDVGPAALGLLRPEIVLPEWLLAASPETLLLVIAHERSHVAARDPGLMGLGMGCAVLMPWNGLLWWLVHRLRLAIEVDCDRRVLHIGHDAGRYARTLVEVSTQRPVYLGALAASSRSFSFIERRLLIISRPEVRGWRLDTAACTLLAIGVATATIFISPPAIPHALAYSMGAAPPTDLQSYIGSYQTSDTEILNIQVQTRRLTATFPGMKPQTLVQQSGQKFRFGNTNAYIRFANDATGHVTGLVIQQNGATTKAPRISAVRVHAIGSAIAARIRAQTAMPGSQAALRDLIVGIESGSPHYAELSPQLAAGTRALLPKLQAQLRPLGALGSIEFRGVNRKGWDLYLVRFKQGIASWDVALNSQGVMVGAGMTIGSEARPGQ